MKIATPPGARSCRRGADAGDGGAWVHLEDSEGEPYLKLELLPVLRACAPADQAVLFAEVQRMVQSAERGELEFVRGHGRERDGDVDLMEVTGCVLELRLTTRTGGPDGRRHVRLYFVEPAAEPDMLLSLKLASKSPDAPGLEEQTAHAQEARARAESWEMNRSPGGLAP